MMTSNTTPNNKKDPVKIVYLDVSFQGHNGGRLALRSRSMTFFTASGERKGNVAWNSIHKVAVQKNNEEQYRLKILNNAHQSLTFQMKDEQDLDQIRNDIPNCIHAWKLSAKEHDPDAKPGSVSASENSLTCFPRFVDEDGGESTRSALTGHNSTRSVTTRRSLQGSTRSVATRSPSHRGGCGFQDEESLATPHSVKKIALEEEADASTIASTAAGSMASHAGLPSSLRDLDDPEAATICSSKMQQPVKVFRDEDYDRPVASFRLVPDQKPFEFYGDPVAPPKKKGLWRSKWFWLALLLIVLLLAGIGIGMGIQSATDKDNSSQTNAVVGLEDAKTITSEQEDITTQAPTPSESIVAAALERTSAPTSPPSLAPSTAAPTNPDCDHESPRITRTMAMDAGVFGGSSYCRANVLALCEWTKWVPFNTYQGVGSAWFQATALEDSFCVADIEHQIQLHVPDGVDYDLHVYHDGQETPRDSSTLSGSNGHQEAVVISGVDGHMSDQSFEYQIQIEFKSGSSCEPWTLTLFGHQCL